MRTKPDLLQQDNLQYYGAIIVPPQGSLQIRTPPDGCEHDNLGKDLNKKRPLDPAPERHVPIEQDEHEEEGREECKVNCKTCCLALTCVLGLLSSLGSFKTAYPSTK